MQIRRPLAATLLFAVMISGCASPPVARPSASPVPTTTPVFASEAEALEAAREAYAAYEAVVDEILESPPGDTDALASVAAGEALEGAIDSANSFASKGYRSVGKTTVTFTGVQRFSRDGSDPGVVAYACLDLSGVDVVDPSGKSVVGESRPDKQPFELTFNFSSAGQLVLAQRDAWDGDGICVD